MKRAKKSDGRVNNGGAREGAGKPKGVLMPQTVAKIQALAEVASERKLTAQMVLDEIAKHAFGNVQDLFDERGNLKPLHELTREQAACIASFEVVKKNAEPGDGQVDIIHKVKMVEKTKSLEMLAKYFALLTEVVRVHDGDKRIERLRRGRERIAAVKGES